MQLVHVLTCYVCGHGDKRHDGYGCTARACRCDGYRPTFGQQLAPPGPKSAVKGMRCEKHPSYRCLPVDTTAPIYAQGMTHRHTSIVDGKKHYCNGVLVPKVAP